MTVKRVIQTYKAPHQWIDSPPGLGDFVRGTCHLFETLQPMGIEQHVLPRAASPLVVTSDCHELKLDLMRRYGLAALPHRSQHGAFGHELPVAMDLCLLKRSRFNHHIKVSAD